MKMLLIAVLMALALAGCLSQAANPSEPQAPLNVPNATQNITSPLPAPPEEVVPGEIPPQPLEENLTDVQASSEGEPCGGAKAIPCETGLICTTDPGNPQSGGICLKPEKKDDNFYSCPSERSEACTKEYVPVCGRLVGATPDVAGYMDFGNACDACSKWTNAIGYFKGTCESRNAK